MDNLALGLRRRFEYAPMFFFEVPTAEEKQAIWQIQLQAHGLDTKQEVPVAKGWTGAEIRNCCAKAKVLGCSVMQAQKWVIPVVQSEAGRIEAIRHSASGKLHSAAVEGTYRFDEATRETFDGGEIVAQTGTRKVKG
jgi:SpoVK/Ycf46/Vps4 family AAA+-type ATPase